MPDIDLCRSGYSRNLNGQPKTTDFDSHQRLRRSSRRRGCIDTLCWLAYPDQRLALEQFHRQQGSDWFELCLPDCNGLSKTTVRWTGPMTIKPVADRFEITASVYVPQPQVMTAADLRQALLTMIGITGGGFEQSIHTFVNTTWPSLL